MSKEATTPMMPLGLLNPRGEATVSHSRKLKIMLSVALLVQSWASACCMCHAHVSAAGEAAVCSQMPPADPARSHDGCCQSCSLQLLSRASRLGELVKPQATDVAIAANAWHCEHAPARDLPAGFARRCPSLDAPCIYALAMLRE